MDGSTATSAPDSPLLKRRPQLAPSTPYLLSNKYALRRAPNTAPKPDTVVQRILNVKEQRIKQLENEVGNLRRQLHDLTSENRTLKAQNQRNSAALSRFQDVEAELPTLLAGHTEEVRVLRQRCQKLAIESREQSRELRTKTVALHMARDQLTRLREVVEEKGLKERQLLQKQLDDSEGRVRELEEQLGTISRQLSLEQKSNRYHLAREQRKTKEALEELKKTEAKVEQLEGNARRKERTLPASLLFGRRKQEPLKKQETESVVSHYSDLNLSSSDEEELTKLYQPAAEPPEVKRISLQTHWAVDSRTFSVRQNEASQLSRPKLEVVGKVQPVKKQVLSEVQEEERVSEDSEVDSEGDNYTKEALLKALEEIDRQNLTEKSDTIITSNGHAVGVRD
ncbi:lebercilin [Neocloeon triangulifer]|uniref:lebercilin n=1 Tax=Neocloeon triangulifer TaxID=2078957 RepID=UPI00286F64F3|nr:lebercilin [Neocloeon triangulifer]